MNNQVTVEANIKYVLIKPCEVVENEASPSCVSCSPINNTRATATNLESQPIFCPSAKKLLKDKLEDFTVWDCSYSSDLEIS